MVTPDGCIFSGCFEWLLPVVHHFIVLNAANLAEYPPAYGAGGRVSCSALVPWNWQCSKAVYQARWLGD